jgi:hypothetical protein
VWEEGAVEIRLFISFVAPYVCFLIRVIIFRSSVTRIYVVCITEFEVMFHAKQRLRSCSNGQ